ncbi:hypothetical protein ACO2I3_15730 [Leptospira interrogans]
MIRPGTLADARVQLGLLVGIVFEGTELGANGAWEQKARRT